MSNTIDKLLILQDCDRKISKLEQETKDIPARKKQIESRLETLRNKMHTVEEAIKKSNLAVKESEGEIESKQQRIAKYREQQFFEVKNNDEYRALDKEIAVVEKEISQLEDGELGTLEKVESQRREFEECSGELKKEEALVQQDVEALNQRSSKNAEEITRLKTERDQLESEIDADWLSKYKRIFEHRGDYAVVQIEKDTCGGCHMKISPQSIHNARSGLSLTQCDYCSRILHHQR